MGDFTIRILTIVIQTVMALIFLYLGLLILKRDKKRLNKVFSTYYFFIVLGTVFNWAYAFLDTTLFYEVALYLNFITNFFYFTSLGFLLVFILIVLKSEKIYNTTKQVIYLVIYLGSLGGFMLLLIHIPVVGVYFDPPSSSPHWTLVFFLIVIIMMSVVSIFPSIYYLIQTSKQFTDQDLKQKFRYFTIGYIEIVIFAYLIAISNFVKKTITTFPTIALLIGTILVITGAYLMYIGVGKQISK